MKYLLLNKKYKEVYTDLSSKIADDLGIKKPIPPPCRLVSLYNIEVGLYGYIPDTDICIEVERKGILRKNTLVEISGSDKEIVDDISSIINSCASSKGYKIKK